MKDTKDFSSDDDLSLELGDDSSGDEYIENMDDVSDNSQPIIGHDDDRYIDPERQKILELERELEMLNNTHSSSYDNNTLQRILSEPMFTDDTALSKDLEDFLEELNDNSTENDTTTASKLRDDKKESTKSILRSEKIKRMGNEIYKPSVTMKVGKSIVMSQSKKYTAFGTDRGIILIFNNEEQELKFILGNTTTDGQTPSTGKVSSIAFSFQEDWLVAGYEQGVIIVWDIMKAGVIKRIDDAFTSPVVNVSFLTDMYNIVASELHSSSMKCFTLSKVLFRYSYSLMFQVSVGDDSIVSIDVLPGTSGQSLMAVATRSGKLYIYEMAKNLKQRGEMMDFGSTTLKGLLPYVSWSKYSGDAILAFGYGKHIYVLNVEMEKIEEIYTTEFNSDVWGIGWFDDRNLIVLNSDEHVTLFDIRPDETSHNIETEDISGTNVLDHYSFPGMKHHSSGITDKGYVVLGDHGLMNISIKPWYERVVQLSELGMWKEALDLNYDFYSGKGKCVIGLPPGGLAEDVISSKTTELVNDYIGLSLFDSTQDEVVFRLVGSVCVENCVRVNQTSAIFDYIYSIFQNCDKMMVFLELIEPYILSGSLKFIPWNIFEKFIELFKGQEERLNQVIMHLDVYQYGKYEQMIRYCTENKLLKAHIYVSNLYKREYVLSLENLYDVFVSKDEKQVADTILHYFEQYLIGNIPETDETIVETKKDIVDFIFDEEEKHGKDSTAVFHSIVKHFPDRFFNVMDIAMRDDSNTNPWDEEFTQENVIDFILRLQQPDQFMKHPSFYDGRIAFFSFYSKFLANGVLKPQDFNVVLVIFTFLAEDFSQRLKNARDEMEKFNINLIKEDREDRFIEILEKRLPTYDKNKFMELAKKYDLYKVAKFLMNSTQKYQWYFEVILRRIFDVAWEKIPEITDQLIVDFQFSNACHQHAVSTLQKMLEEETDLTKCRSLRFFLYSYITSLLLDPSSETSSLNMNEVAKRGISIDDLTYTYLQLVCEFEEHKKVKEFLKQQGSNLDAERCMKICKDIPEAKSFLLERTGEVKHALNEILREVEHALDLLKLKLIDEVQRKENSEFELYFEMIARDFNLITDDPPVFSPNEPIQDQIDNLAKRPKIKLPQVTSQEGCILEGKVALEDVLHCHESKILIKELKTAINLCCENSERKTLDDSEVRTLWFRLLNTFVLLQRKLRYGFLEGKPLAHKQDEKEAHKPSSHDAEFDEFDLEGEFDDFDIIKEEIVDTNNGISKIEKQLAAERELQDPDENLIEELQVKLKRRKDHVLNLQLQLKELEEKEKSERLMEDERNNDPRAPHNLQKLSNLWLQRCNSLYTRVVLSDMMRYVDIPSILNYIVNEHDSDAFGHIKATIVRLLDSYSYESGLLKQSNELISFDIYNIGHQLAKDSLAAVKPMSRYCHTCSNPLGKRVGDNTMVRIFPCGHSYHVSCIGVHQIACLICDNKDEKETKSLLKTSHIFKSEGAKAKYEEESGKKSDTNNCRNVVDELLKKTSGVEMLEELSKVKPNNKPKKNIADMALDMLSGTSGSTVQSLTGIKILDLTPPTTNTKKVQKQKTAATLVAVDEEDKDHTLLVKTRNRSSSLRNGKVIPRIKIMDFDEIVKEIEEMYD